VSLSPQNNGPSTDQQQNQQQPLAQPSSTGTEPATSTKAPTPTPDGLLSEPIQNTLGIPFSQSGADQQQNQQKPLAQPSSTGTEPATSTRSAVVTQNEDGTVAAQTSTPKDTFWLPPVSESISLPDAVLTFIMLSTLVLL
jgi:hypothetical protein